ncbi:PLD nuclease N-terminal domain-containing protein [Pseudomonas sp. DWP3-1-2]|uniref:PLD nuclease N-terminal domain-containing protein n=1 Tax=Pseudomonas sp. DWP3-1-2 TaxID=2804645 RepID=UPI003CF2D819
MWEISQAGMWFAIGAVVIVMLLDIWAINSVWRSEKSGGTKMMWVVLILALPLIGLVVWGISGPRGIVKGPSSPEHSKG